MRVLANAKLNWTLDILSKDATGYHQLDMLTTPVSLCDELTFDEADTLTLSIPGCPELSEGQDNLVIKAAQALQKIAPSCPGARITLQKHIPMGAGLGGGSADAAATLRALNLLWNLQLDEEQLQKIAISLGADVPVCLWNSPARVRGIGEKLTPISVGREFELVLVKPCTGLATRDVFLRADQLPILHPDTELTMNVLAAGDIRMLSGHPGNALMPAALSLRHEIGDALRALDASGAQISRMTGSGVVVYGVYENAAAADHAADDLMKIGYSEIYRAHSLK